MSEILSLLFDWSDLASRGADVVVYLVLAGIGSLLFLIRLGLAFFGGPDSDFDTDLESGVDTDVSFSLFSLLSILAFFMGAGWMGLACRLDWSMGSMAAALCSAGFGVVMMLSASGLAYLTRRLNRQVDYDIQTAVGRTAQVYLPIPEKGRGTGQVRVSISGRSKIVTARSSGVAIAAFTDVRVLAVDDAEVLTVEPAV